MRSNRAVRTSREATPRALRVLGCALLLCLWACVAAPVNADDFASRNNAANELVDEGKLDEALRVYREVEIERPDKPEIDYNIGNVYHLRNQFDSAATEYQDALATLEGSVAPNAFYNLGNTLFRLQQYDLAVESYKHALIENPADQDAKYNLELALRRLQQQDSTEQEQQEQQDEQDNQEQSDSTQEQENQDQQQENQPDSTQEQQNQDQQQDSESEEQQEQPQGEPSEQDEGQQQQQQPQQVGMTKEDAERILDALRQRELEVQKQRAVREGVPANVDKDW